MIEVYTVASQWRLAKVPSYEDGLRLQAENAAKMVEAYGKLPKLKGIFVKANIELTLRYHDEFLLRHMTIMRGTERTQLLDNRCSADWRARRGNIY